MKHTQRERKEAMPKTSLHALTWSQEHQHYELHMHGQLHQCFPRGDEAAWLTWLAEHTAFAFQGQHGRISVIKEARERGTGYWYAYRRQDRHTSKRYLGPPAKLTFARLGEWAQALLAGHRLPLWRPYRHSARPKLCLLGLRARP